MAAGRLQERSGAAEAGERAAVSNGRKPDQGPAGAVPAADHARHATGTCAHTGVSVFERKGRVYAVAAVCWERWRRKKNSRKWLGQESADDRGRGGSGEKPR